MHKLKNLFFKIEEPISIRTSWILSSITLLVLVIIAASYSYFDFLSLPPKGFHFIRQTDSLSFSSTYFHYHNGLFNPQIYNLTSTNGNAACEFPFLYYLQARLYSLFGENYWIARGSSLLVVMIGYFMVFRSLIKDSQSWLISIGTVLASLSSTIILFYSINFLPDAAAFGFCLMGIAFMMKSKYAPSKKHLYLAFLFFAFGALIKVTYLIYPIAFTLNEIIRYKLGQKNEMKPQGTLIVVLTLAISCLLVVSIWILYANQYNKENGSNYFMMQSSPYWKLTAPEISSVWDHLLHYWRVSFYYLTTQHLFFYTGLFALIAAIIKKSGINFLLVLLICGSLSYFLLFFEKFRDHDYYILTIMPTFMLAFYYAQLEVIRWKVHKAIGPIMLLASISISLLSFNYGMKKCSERFNAADPSGQEAPTKLLNKDAVKKVQQIIPENKNVTVIGDLTPNASLYYLKRQGFSISNNSDFQLLPHPEFCANFIILLPGNIISEEIKLKCQPELLTSIEGIEIYSTH